jgi:hypothetical protein
MEDNIKKTLNREFHFGLKYADKDVVHFVAVVATTLNIVMLNFNIYLASRFGIISILLHK